MLLENSRRLKTETGKMRRWRRARTVPITGSSLKTLQYMRFANHKTLCDGSNLQMRAFQHSSALRKGKYRRAAPIATSAPSSRKIAGGSGIGAAANPYEQHTSVTGVTEGRLTIVKFPS